jgi:hypothetical protein
LFALQRIKIDEKNWRGQKIHGGQNFLISHFKERDEKSAGAKIPHLGQFQKRDEKSAGAKSKGAKNPGERKI